MRVTHTPGPWTARGTAGHERHGQSVVYADTDGKDVAIIYDGDADACLIAAAPQMWEALLEASRALTELDPLAEHHNATMLDDAIRKARGE